MVPALQLLEIIFTFFTLNVLCEEEPMPEAEEELAPLLGLDAELELLGFDAELELLGFVPALELLGFVEELALSPLAPAPLPSDPVIRT